MKTREIPPFVAAYALGLHHAPADRPPFAWRTIARLLQAAGLGNFHAHALRAAALEWGAGNVAPEVLALFDHAAAARRRHKKGPPQRAPQVPGSK